MEEREVVYVLFSIVAHCTGTPPSLPPFPTGRDSDLCIAGNGNRMEGEKEGGVGLGGGGGGGRGRGGEGRGGEVSRLEGFVLSNSAAMAGK